MTLTDALAHALHRIAYHDWDEATDDPPVMDVGDFSDSGNGTAFELASAILADPAFREALTTALAEATEASRSHLNWQIMPVSKQAGIIVDYLLPAADHA